MQIHSYNAEKSYNWVDNKTTPKKRFNWKEPNELVGQFEILLGIVSVNYWTFEIVENCPVNVEKVSEDEFRQ